MSIPGFAPIIASAMAAATATEIALAHASGYELRNAFVNGIYPRSPPFFRLLANRFCECTLA
jgi:hypothetical protein